MAFRSFSRFVVMLAVASLVGSAQRQFVNNSDVVVRKYAAVPLESLKSDERRVVQTLLTRERPTIGVNCPDDEASSAGRESKPAYRGQPYIVHLTHWQVNADGTYTLGSSRWRTYRLKKRGSECSLVEATPAANGEPRLYGDKAALLVGIHQFDAAVYRKQISISYKAYATPATAENVASVGALAKALLGISGSGLQSIPGLQHTVGGGPPEPSLLNIADYHTTWIAAGELQGVNRLPFDFNVSPTLSVAPQGSLPDAKVGTPYIVPLPEIKDDKGKKPIKIAIKIVNAGDLFENLTVVGNEGEWRLSGKPVRAGRSSIVVEITDEAARYREPLRVAFSLNVEGAGSGSSSTVSAAKTDGGSGAAKAGNEKEVSSAVPVVDCIAASSSSPCTFARKFRSHGHEAWDFSLAVSVPGVREPRYSAADPAATPSVTRHTDLYGMLDIYPFARFDGKESAFPHLIVGLPVTGKPFYRPFFGVGQNVTSWTGLERIGFPLRLSVFAGLVYMRQQYVVGNPDATPSAPALVIQQGRSLKAMYGIEVPLGALVGKIGKSEAK